MTLHPDAAVAKYLADSHTQIISRGNALALGMTDRMIKFRVDTGQWIRIKPGVYRIGPNGDEWRTTLEAATQKLPAVVSHESAAYLHGFEGFTRGIRAVTVPIRNTKQFPGVFVHQSTDIGRRFVTRVAGLPMTTATRTVIDLAHDLSDNRLLHVVETCVVRGYFTLNELANDFARLARRGRPGVSKMRLLFALLMPDLESIESELERLYLDLVRQHGLPMPEIQAPFPWRNDQAGRVDFLYREAKLIIECDGRRWHADSNSFEQDRRRDNRAMLAGYRVLRITWDMITKEPEKVVGMIRAALTA